MEEEEPYRPPWWRPSPSTTRTSTSHSSPVQPASVSLKYFHVETPFISKRWIRRVGALPEAVAVLPHGVRLLPGGRQEECPVNSSNCLLQRIVATDARQLGFRYIVLRVVLRLSLTVWRCPICRELIRIPPAGLNTFPPSFLVNQLLDLMAGQARQIITNCSQHNNQVDLRDYTQPLLWVIKYSRSRAICVVLKSLLIFQCPASPRLDPVFLSSQLTDNFDGNISNFSSYLFRS